MPFPSNSKLPESVRNVLPERAQTIWRGAFNSFLEENPDDEEGAAKVAWAAVKRKFKKEGDKWVTKDGAYELVDSITMDASDIRTTGDGYLVATPRVARTGIQLYAGREVGRDDMEIVRVYRPENEVFNRDALHSYAHRPLTNDHPPVLVTADNWRKYAIGQTGDEIARDGDFIRVPLVMMDATAISDVKNGKRQLSLGYTCDLKWEPGTSPNGEQYDAIQTSIRANHLAVVKAARGGENLRIGDNNNPATGVGGLFSDGQIAELADLVHNYQRRKESTMSTADLKTVTVDGLSVQMTDMAANVVQRHIAGLEKSLDNFKKKLEEEIGEKEKAVKAKDEAVKQAATDKSVQDAKIATLEKQLKDAELTPAKLDALVKDRAVVVGKAKAVLGDKLVIDGKTIVEIQRQVVDANLGDVAKGWNDEQIASSFTALTAKVAAQASMSASAPGSTVDHLASAFADNQSHNAADAVTKAYIARDQQLSNAWKTPKPAAA